MDFAVFTRRFMPIYQADSRLQAHVPPSLWQSVFVTGDLRKDGELVFDAHELAAQALPPGEAQGLAEHLAAALNAEFAPSQAGGGGAQGGASSGASSSDLPDDGHARRRATAEAPSSAPAFEQAQTAGAGAGAEAASAAALGDAGEVFEDDLDKESTYELTWPTYDYSREDISDPLPAVAVGVEPAGLRYRWPGTDADEVFRVTFSDEDFPFTPDGADGDWSVSTHYLDETERTTDVRFITVWGYEILDAEKGNLGQPRKVAAGVHVAAISNWTLIFDEGENAVFSRWDRPNLPSGVTGAVITSRMPYGQNLGHFLGRGTWQNDQMRISSTDIGFQDSAVQPGREHHYVVGLKVTYKEAAREGGLREKTVVSSPVHRSITLPVRPDPITDLEIEAITLERKQSLRLTWSQRPGSEVSIYRSQRGPNSQAVAQGTITSAQLEQADLPAELRVQNLAQPTGQVTSDGREVWTMEDLNWPLDVAWDTIHLTPVTVVDADRVVIGRPVQRRRAGRVENITVIQRMDWQLVTFSWPGEAAQVELRIAHPEAEFSPDIPVNHVVEKDTYTREGGFRIKDGLPPGGCRLFLTAVTFFGGQRILSDPTVAAVEPTWGFAYSLSIPAPQQEGGLRGLLRRGPVLRTGELTVRPVSGTCPDSEAPELVLVHRSDRLPLHAQDGSVVELLQEAPGGEVVSTPLSSLRAPVAGGRTLWFDVATRGAGYYRLVVRARPASALPPAERRTALERYALVDPPLTNLRTS